MYTDKGIKFLTVRQVQRLLSDLDPDLLLSPNEVRNIAIYSGEDKYVGFIDFLFGEIDIWEGEIDENFTDRPNPTTQ